MKERDSTRVSVSEFRVGKYVCIHTRHVCICIYRRIIRYATDTENNVTRKESRGCGGIRCAGSREGEGRVGGVRRVYTPVTPRQETAGQRVESERERERD